MENEDEGIVENEDEEVMENEDEGIMENEDEGIMENEDEEIVENEHEEIVNYGGMELSDTESESESNDGEAIVLDDQIFNMPGFAHLMNMNPFVAGMVAGILSAGGQQVHDPAVVPEHKYLGNLREVKQSVEFPDSDRNYDVMHIPIILPSSVQMILVPGQILPLAEREEIICRVLKQMADSNGVFGIITSDRHNQSGLDTIDEWLQDIKDTVVGTTAEIFEHNFDGVGEGYFAVKARGKERFRILDIRSHQSTLFDVRVINATVKILRDVHLPLPLSHVDHKGSLSKQYSLERSKFLSAYTPWPHFVFDQYDERLLVIKAKKLMMKYFSENSVNLSDDPTYLSYQILRIIPMDFKNRMEGMRYNTTVQRLQFEIKVLEKQGEQISCCSCGEVFAMKSSVFSMSDEGPQGTYCNTHGYVHEIITVKEATNVHIFPHHYSSQFTWFPGYEWAILNCRHCSSHVGWKYRAKNNTSSPYEFYGLRYASIKSTADDSEGGANPVANQ